MNLDKLIDGTLRMAVEPALERVKADVEAPPFLREAEIRGTTRHSLALYVRNPACLTPHAELAMDFRLFLDRGLVPCFILDTAMLYDGVWKRHDSLTGPLQDFSLQDIYEDVSGTWFAASAIAAV